MLNGRYKIDSNTGCWIWTGSTSGNGYGKFVIAGKQIGAHRAAYENKHGKIPDGMCVLHKCDNPPCVNPEHLFLGTHKDNADDKVSKGRHNYQYHGKGPSGEKSHTAKLTAENVLFIRSSSLPPVELASKFSVTNRTIRMILSRTTWSHL